MFDNEYQGWSLHDTKKKPYSSILKGNRDDQVGRFLTLTGRLISWPLNLATTLLAPNSLGGGYANERLRECEAFSWDNISFRQTGLYKLFLSEEGKGGNPKMVLSPVNITHARSNFCRNWAQQSPQLLQFLPGLGSYLSSP